MARTNASGRAKALLAVALFGLAPLPSRAAEEIRIPLDPATGLERIDAELARRLHLFADVPDFHAAQLFRIDDSTFVHEIERMRHERLVRARSVLDAAQVEALRDDIRRRLAEFPAPRTADRSGRSLLLGGSLLLGLGFYDWALPYALDASDRNAVAIGMLAASGSFFVPLLLARDADVTPGMAHLSLYGGTRGIVHGMLAFEAATAHRLSRTGDDRARIGGAVAGSLLEAAGGYFWARRSAVAPGDAHAMGAGGDFGLVFGFGLAEILDGDDDLLDGDEGGLQYAAGLAGAAAGLWGVRRWVAHRAYTWGDAEVARLAGLTGGLAGVAMADASDTDDADWFLVAGLAGTAAGMVAGHRIVAATQYGAGEALLVDASAVAGAAVALGLVFLDSGTDASSGAYTGAAALGAVGGFAIGWATTRRDATERAGVARERNWDLAFDPLGILLGRVAGEPEARPAPRAPVVALRGRF